MKTALIYSTCFAVCFGVSAQTETANEKRGAKLFDEYDYMASVETLEAVDRKSVDVMRELAESYDMMGDYTKAETYLAQICTHADRVPNDHLNYARILMKNEKYNEAEMQLKIYGTLNPENEEAARFQLLNESVQQFTRYGANFSVQSMSMNSDQEDFAPVMYENQLYFASSRYKTKSVWRRWSGNHLPFLDICVAEINQDNVSKWWLFENKEINRRYHEGPVTFSPNGNELYITRNNYDGKGPDGTRQLQLLVSTKSGTTWSEPVKLPFNSNDFSVGHATLSPDGNLMVFASDMPGGKGGVDLYKTIRTNGTWSTPENLTKINTTGDEMFPYLHAGGVLIFSSNGHPGYGGLDLYVGQWKNANVTRFQNLGSPMNSPADDFSVWLNPEMSHGYFASNRTGGKGNDDLYSFSMKSPFSFGRNIKGTAKDQAGNLLPGARIRITDDQGTTLTEVISGDQGEFVFETDKTGNFTILGTKEKYFDGTSLLSVTDESAVDMEQEVVLEKDPGFALLAVITDKQSKAGLDSVKVILINNMSGEQEVVYTNAKGEIFRPIRDRKINDRISYNIRLEKKRLHFKRNYL